MRRLVAAALAVAVAGLVPATAPAAGEGPRPRKGFWVAGDLHVHTIASHDSWAGPVAEPDTPPEEWYTLGHTVESQFRIASARGLDFTAITDHNDVSSQSDPGWGAHGVLGLPGYENSLDGHAQMLGATRLHPDAGTAAEVQALADALRAEGGVFQVNHPAGETVDEHALDWGYGYAVQPDTVEVWNISALWQPPAPSGNSIDLAVGYWEGWLDRGAHVGATGGSDNHYLATTAVQGVGQPTTWVFVRELSVDGVLDGLRAGRTTISHQPPAHRGPRAFLEADRHGDGVYEAMVGDDVPGRSRFRVRVEGAPGALLRLFADGGRLLAEVPVTSPAFTHGFRVPAGTTWVRAEVVEPDGAEVRRATCDPVVGSRSSYCHDRLALLALTSALYVNR